MSGQVQKTVHVGHGDTLRTISDFHDVIARPNFSFLQHAKVKPGSMMGYEQGWHTGLIHADAHAVAGHTRLRYFEHGTTDTVLIAYRHLVIRKSLDREVFSELTESKIRAAEKAFPVMVGVHLVDKYGAMFPSVTSQIALRVTINIELAHHAPSGNRKFPDCGSDSFTVPCHVAGKTDIYGKQSRHAYLAEAQVWLGSLLFRSSGRLKNSGNAHQGLGNKALISILANGDGVRERSCLGIRGPSVRPIARALREPRMDPQSTGFPEQPCRPGTP